MKNKFKITRNRFLMMAYLTAIFVGVIGTYLSKTVEVYSLPVNKKNIVIDAGHGGWDPGKVVANGTEEKDINLAIATKLQAYLEQGGAIVTTTRVDDQALSENKRQDLKDRKKMGQNEDVDLFVSVHQNAFPKESIKGAQVFYFKDSEEGKILATAIQDRLKEVVDIDNSRQPKANNEYYLLKSANNPSVIVECGFLSNNAEYKKLKTDEYQEKIAWAIYMGILDYFGQSAV